ncbi:hypothetical protein OEM_p200130 (plasmid) [Mycobacterium intracellulare subsp. yongonense 05-1390]|nr:hypothetical protein OEM_p200130 [Mycobacterium intracellulare subsp. yongonense 05-1390]
MLGRLPTVCVVAEPCPRTASTATPNAFNTPRAAVTERLEHLARSARTSFVTATLRPVAWSANSAIATATASTVAAEITRRVLNSGPDKSTRRSAVHNSRDDHIGTAAGTAPQRSIDALRASLARILRSRADAVPLHGEPDSGTAAAISAASNAVVTTTRRRERREPRRRHQNGHVNAQMGVNPCTRMHGNL